MVAMTIGLVLALVISLSMLSMGQQFRVVGANSAAQVNAQLGLSLIDQAGRAAGAGLFNNGKPLCQSFNASYGGVVKSNGAVLMPVRIVSGGGAGVSDRIVFSSSAAVGPLSGMPVLDAMATSDAAIVVGNTGMLDVGDIAVVGVPGTATPCTLFQVSAAPVVGAACGGNAAQCKTVAHVAGGIARPRDLGGDDDLVAQAPRGNPAAEHALGIALSLRPGRDRVVFGRVEQGDTGVMGHVELAQGVVLGRLPAESHDAQAEGADFDAAAAELTVLQAALLFRRGGHRRSGDPFDPVNTGDAADDLRRFRARIEELAVPDSRLAEGAIGRQLHDPGRGTLGAPDFTVMDAESRAEHRVERIGALAGGLVDDAAGRTDQRRLP